MSRTNPCNYCALVEIKERCRDVEVRYDTIVTWGRVTVFARGKEVAHFEELTEMCICGKSRDRCR